MEAKYLINIGRLARLSGQKLVQQLDELVLALSQLQLRDSAKKHVSAERDRFVLWSKISLAALIPEVLLLPVVYQNATPAEFGLYLALLPTTVAAYKELSGRVSVCGMLLDRLVR